MCRTFNFVIFILTVFKLLQYSGGQWIDYLCKHQKDLEVKYKESAIVLLPANFVDHKNKTWQYRKLCLYGEKDNGKCVEIGVILNGTEYSRFPKTLRIQRDTSEDIFFPELKRIRRATKRASNDLPPDYFYGESTCQVPNNLRTAEVMCKIFPSSIKCKSYCVYGSTFDEGIVRTHACKYSENRWSREFEECRPFVDCALKLVSPGNLKCVGNEIMKTPWCEVECSEYEDKDETKSQKYACLANGKWQPPLPHCVELKGTDLARAPSVKEHKALTYP